MFNERAFINRLESADTPLLIEMLARPSTEGERALVSYFGEERYERLHMRAVYLKMGRRAHQGARRGKVVVVPGFMGSTLHALDGQGKESHLWFNPHELMHGTLDRLRLAESGRTDASAEVDIRVSGVAKRYYAELLLALEDQWETRAFWYDWRKSFDLVAEELNGKLNHWFEARQEVHLIAHGSGGLLVRAYIARFPESWKARGGRLIMLGTPNHGTYMAPLILGGIADETRRLALLNPAAGVEGVRRVVTSFDSLYQMLPSPLRDPEMAPLYRATTYNRPDPTLDISQARLDQARQHHRRLRRVVYPERMFYVAGTGQPTYVSLDIERFQESLTTLATRKERDGGAEPKQGSELQPPDPLYCTTIGLEGDGNTPATLALLENDDGPVPTYYVRCTTTQLPAKRSVLAALNELLADGRTELLSASPPAPSGTPEGARAGSPYIVELAGLVQADDEELHTLQRRLRSATTDPTSETAIADEERAIERLVTRHLVVQPTDDEGESAFEIPIEPTTIRLYLRCTDIAQVHSDYAPDGLPVDVVAVGHYRGSPPAGSVGALDLSVSAAMGGSVSRESALFAHFVTRGILRGELGQPFFLPDPRDGEARRLVAIVGMGVPGRFGDGELKVVMRELSWSLGRLGKQHLAMPLIGAGLQNLDTRTAVAAWISGLKAALTGVDPDRHLKAVTLVTNSPAEARRIDGMLREHRERLRATRRLMIEYEGLDATSGEASARLREEIRAAEKARTQTEIERLQKALEEPEQGAIEEAATPGTSTRVAVSLVGKRYRFGALTTSASIPEREIPLDPELVVAANEELASESNPKAQLERGQLLGQLLFPDDLASVLQSSAPLVMMLDATTARIHWELVANSDALPVAAPRDAAGEQRDARPTGDGREYFLSTAGGITRQLRTTFAPPPEPPPPPRRVLRVLVVANPAAEAPLPGAEEEGIIVADLFERFNTLYSAGQNRTEVVRLFGPRRATRTAVLRELMLRSYDVLHFAGHSLFDKEEPSASGWIFSKGQRLSANEFRRIDRAPSFIFSNSCESGITPDRAEARSVELAPSLAEALLERGVSNFVCTAWPVDDTAAREFAVELYGRLLGISGVGPDHLSSLKASSHFAPMHEAMKAARRATADARYGARTWGAYQHYGDPFFRFFESGKKEAP